MQPGRVYRRQDLLGFTTAIDRDLKNLLDCGEVRKLAWGVYCRSRTAAPPGDEELVRAFLKTRDFRLVTQEGRVVYNRKRAGVFILDGRRFRFRLARTYPENLASERAVAGSPVLGGASVVRDGPVRLVDRGEETSDLAFWLEKPPEERVAAVEVLREQYYAMAGYKCLPGLARTLRLRRREE